MASWVMTATGQVNYVAEGMVIGHIPVEIEANGRNYRAIRR